jgi:hypothetical protein
MNAELDEVTSDPAQPDQMVQKIGNFHHDTWTGGWDGFFIFSPLVDDGGQPMRVHLDGRKTLRFTVGPGAFDWNYLLFDATPDDFNACPDITVTAAQGGCSQVANWNVSTSENCSLDLGHGIQFNIYGGFDPFSPSGSPYFDLVGTLTAGEVNTGFNWHPFGLFEFGADITGSINVASGGTYTFGLDSDDGSQLYIDGVLIIDDGGAHPPQLVTANINLAAGTHSFEVQFFECCGGASAVNLNLPAGVTYVNPDARPPCDPPSGSSFPVGTTLVNCTATDTSGNVGSCSFHVVVIDTQPPTITCPAPITVPAASGQCSAKVTFTPTVSDNCAGVASVCSPASGTTFMVGKRTVNCTATDASGNSTSCSFVVTVIDNQPSTITCPPNISKSTDHGVCGALATWAAPVAKDNCGVQSVTCAPASGSVFAVGTTTVQCTATDVNGLTASCNFTVTVQQGSICGKVFYDANANGLDDDAQVVAGWRITLSGRTATGSITPVTKFTDAGGNYCFDVLPGMYTVTESLPNTKWASTTATSGGVSVSSGACHPGPNFGVVCTQPPTNGLTVGFWSNKNGQNILQAHDSAWRTLLNGCNLRNPDGSSYQVPGGTFSTAYGNFHTYLTSISASNMANMLSVQLAATTLSVAYNNLSDSTGLVVPACLVTLSGSNVVKCLKLPLMVGQASTATCSGNNCASANGFITIGALRALAKASLGTDANTTKQTPQRGYQECLKALLDEVNNNGNPPAPSSYNCPLSSVLSSIPCPFTSPY